jgi:small subunit ribosomal protein S9
MVANKYTWGTGRRKTAVARVRIIEGSGKIEVNKRPVEEFFTEDKHRADVYAPLEATDLKGKLDVYITVDGGGISGQAGAAMLGIARALKKYKPDADHALREGGFLTRDSRMKERKKYGQKGARKKFQFSKR